MVRGEGETLEKPNRAPAQGKNSVCSSPPPRPGKDDSRSAMAERTARHKAEKTLGNQRQEWGPSWRLELERNFPQLIKPTDPRVRQAERNPGRINLHKGKLKHVIPKLPNTSNEEKTLNAGE